MRNTSITQATWSQSATAVAGHRPRADFAAAAARAARTIVARQCNYVWLSSVVRLPVDPTRKYIDIMLRTYDFKKLRSAQINKELRSTMLLN